MANNDIKASLEFINEVRKETARDYINHIPVENSILNITAIALNDTHIAMSVSASKILFMKFSLNDKIYNIEVPIANSIEMFNTRNRELVLKDIILAVATEISKIIVEPVYNHIQEIL